MSLLASRSRSAIGDAAYATLKGVGLQDRTIVAVDVDGSVPAYTDANGRAPATVYGDRYDDRHVPAVITPPHSCGRDCVGQIDTFLPEGMKVKAVRHLEIGVRNVGAKGPKQHIFRLVAIQQQGVRQALWVPRAALAG